MGINDADYLTSVRTKEKRIVCPFYSVWRDMLRRCYDSKFRERHPSYVGCSVAEEWLTFSTFKSWMETQDWEDKDLDKDLCGNGLIYNKENCVFISQELNKFLTLRSHFRSNSLLGVRLDKRTGKFYAQGNLGGKRIHLGTFTCKEDAHFCYLAHKREQVEGFIAKESDYKIILALSSLKDLLTFHIEERQVMIDVRR